jgi:cell division protein ZapA
MAGIMVMDELSEVNRRLKNLEAEVGNLTNGRDAALSDQLKNEEALASALSEVTQQIHGIAAKLNGRPTTPSS